jgi:hypothetical protein
MAESSPTPVRTVDHRPSSKSELASGHLEGTFCHRGDIGGTRSGVGWSNSVSQTSSDSH